MGNQFEAGARARKVAALVRHLDAELLRIGADPFKDAAVMVQTLRTDTTADHWRRHAIIAGQRPPSEETIAEVIATYEVRAKLAGDNVVPLRRLGGLH